MKPHKIDSDLNMAGIYKKNSGSVNIMHVFIGSFLLATRYLGQFLEHDVIPLPLRQRHEVGLLVEDVGDALSADGEVLLRVYR